MTFSAISRQNMEKKLFYKKGNIVEILYMSGSSKTHV